MMKPTLMILALALAVGCQSKLNSNEEQAEATEQAVEQPVRERQVRQRSEPAPATREVTRDEGSRSVLDPARELPKLRGELDHDGYGLSLPIDGSSPSNFLSSMEMIAADTSHEQYEHFHTALSYLQVYGLQRDLASFYESLDGLTAEEVIERVESHRAPRY